MAKVFILTNEEFNDILTMMRICSIVDVKNVIESIKDGKTTYASFMSLCAKLINENVEKGDEGETS